MLEVSDDFHRLVRRIWRGKAVAYSGVKNAYEDVVYARVGTKEDKEAVVHDAEAHIHSRESFVCHLILKEHYLSIVKDWILFS